ncbi:hypothetical protein BY458DRAFT_510556 [Sporodiniella umbellata]|nr:hypothetical protein BY458DRAFT_510556 [Sporodiniella umbellata]
MEDDWERDIHFSDTQVFQRKGVYTIEPDKELTLACERYQYQQEYLEDSESETNSSVQSTYSAITDGSSLIHGLDDFMYAKQKSGTIQKLGGHRPGKVFDYDDWSDELDILPSKFVKPKARTYESHLSLLDTAESYPQSNMYAASNVYQCEPEPENDDSLTGLHFPQDLTTLAQRLYDQKCGATIQPAPPEQDRFSDMLASIQREKEDDDFCEGLNLKTLPIGKKGSQETKGRSQPPQSRIPLLKPVRVPPPKPSLSRPHRFTLGTAASKRREAETRAQVNRLKPKKQDAAAVIERRGANGTTLIARPKKNKDYEYSPQLDDLDTLPTLKPKKKFVLPAHPKGENTMDPERPWRKNMLRASKVKLIKPCDQAIKKEFNGMRFDESSQSWKGNEKALLAFQKSTVRRPILISNRQQTSKYTSVIVNNMIFDTEKLQWVSAFGPEAEHDELDGIEDLEEPASKKNNKGLEFKLSVEVKREMMFNQEKHQSWIEHWPL